MAKLSRKRIARYVVDSVEAGTGEAAIRQVASHVLAEKREREVELIIRDIHAEFEARGVTLASVTTAHKLDDKLKRQIKQLIDTDRIELAERLDPGVLGGMAIETPTRRLDATIKRRLITLRESKG